MRKLLLGSLTGAGAGLSATLFLFLLDWATRTRKAQPGIIWLLPLAGGMISWMYYRWGKEVHAGSHLILDEIHQPKKIIPFRMAPLVLIGTVTTHLFGGSAGREGTAVQMGASLGEYIAKILKVLPRERKHMLMAGAGAGFGAAVGTPWAGAIFGWEILLTNRKSSHHNGVALIEGLIASFTGYGITLALHAPHSVYPKWNIPTLDIKNMAGVAIAGIIFGLIARIFLEVSHRLEGVFAFITYSPLKTFIGGCLLVLLYRWDGSYLFAGLGIEEIQRGLNQPGSFYLPLMKGLFTALTLSVGYKGGEFIPLVFMGTTLGSALSHYIPCSHSLLAGVGFAAVFAGAAHTPLACACMIAEIFGWPLAPYALIGCFMSHWFSGTSGIYKPRH